MELVDDCCNDSRIARKRKAPDSEQGGEDCNMLSRFSLDELNQDLLEKVLSWLPASLFFRLSSVCKRWKSISDSASFKLACSNIPSRDPWFFMVNSNPEHSIIFDSTENNWKRLNYPHLLQQNPHTNSIPVAASGGLICFCNSSGNFIISNPITGSCNELPPLNNPTCPENNPPLHAIVMTTSFSNHNNSPCYKLVLVCGQHSKLYFRVYNSSTGFWAEESSLIRNNNEPNGLDTNEDSAMYFLTKAGNVVAANMQRCPSKQYSSVITSKDGEEIVYFVSSSGTIMACNLSRRSFLEYPRLLPVFSEYSIDLVECRGEMLVVMLSEFLESASLRIWRFDEGVRSWRQIAVMPVWMSHGWFGKKVDINCVGTGDRILICVNSVEVNGYVLCDLGSNQWVELPKCCLNGEVVEFMSAFTFEPRIEASV